mmetsp:Transcript_22002/g.49682  ORF Transcript_22002/g.49682 Transcript_22002/m.49682 type:complete len:315 (-) Transcript_22002:772-1716(-)
MGLCGVVAARREPSAAVALAKREIHRLTKQHREVLGVASLREVERQVLVLVPYPGVRPELEHLRDRVVMALLRGLHKRRVAAVARAVDVRPKLDEALDHGGPAHVRRDVHRSSPDLGSCIDLRACRDERVHHRLRPGLSSQVQRLQPRPCRLGVRVLAVWVRARCEQQQHLSGVCAAAGSAEACVEACFWEGCYAPYELRIRRGQGARIVEPQIPHPLYVSFRIPAVLELAGRAVDRVLPLILVEGLIVPHVLPVSPQHVRLSLHVPVDIPPCALGIHFGRVILRRTRVVPRAPNLPVVRVRQRLLSAEQRGFL